jgi:glutaconate CoA-transferase subunit B
MVVTDLTVMAIDKITGKLQIVKLMPGVSLEHVRENTGFQVATAPGMKTVELPTAEELNILRKEVDPEGEYLGKEF